MGAAMRPYDRRAFTNAIVNYNTREHSHLSAAPGGPLGFQVNATGPDYEARLIGDFSTLAEAERSLIRSNARSFEPFAWIGGIELSHCQLQPLFALPDAVSGVRIEIVGQRDHLADRFKQSIRLYDKIADMLRFLAHVSRLHDVFEYGNIPSPIGHE